MKQVLKKTIGLFFIISFILTGCGSNSGDASIKVYSRDTTSGTREGFFGAIGLDDAIKNDANLVSGSNTVDSNGSMISAIKNDEYGIGYISLATLENSGVKGLVYNGVAPSVENVLNETYQLTRNFNYIVADEFANEKEEQIIEAFLAFLTTKDAKYTTINNDGIASVDQDAPTWDAIKGNYPIHSENNSAVTIKFGGSTSVEKIARALSAEFRVKCGNFIVEHNHTGSSDAFKRTQGGEANGVNFLHVGFLSRDFNEVETFSEGTTGRLCIDAIVNIVNMSNKITQITDEQLKQIYGVNGNIRKWSELK